MHSRIPFINLAFQHARVEAEINDAIAQVVRSNTFVLDKALFEFEKQYAAYQQVSYCAGVGNGLDAIYLALKALGIEPGDEAIVPSNTYIATWLAVEKTGATIVPVEPDERTYNLDVSKIDSALTSKTKCIVPVHLFGQACQMDDIMKIANKRGLWVVEDNAQAQGSSYRTKKTGGFGHANATSFYPTKNLGAMGDGGAITLNSKELYDRVCALRNYGSTKKYFSETLGINSRLDEIQAAILSIKLNYLEGWNEERKILAATYFESLAHVGDLILPLIASGSDHVFHIFNVRTNHRDALQSYLKDQGIDTSIHYPVPPHLQKAFAHLGYAIGDFAIAEKLANTSLSLPIWPGLSKKEQELIVKTIKDFFEHHL